MDLRLTYEVKDNGYTIKNNGVVWMEQKKYIPFPSETLEESAQLHIANILENQTKENEEFDFKQKYQEQQIKLEQAESAIAELTMLVSMQMV